MILIVDDDANLAGNCSMFLESQGYDVHTATSAEDALSQIKLQQPYLLISDCCMPGLSGLELSQQLQAAPNGSPFPILLMSGSQQCRVAPGKSYDAFIKKPFLAETLLSQVQQLLDGKAPTSVESA